METVVTLSTRPWAIEPTVTLITALAEATDLSADEYRAIYDRVAHGRSLRNVELALRSGVTFGWWAGYANGTKHLDRERKNELRRWARQNGGPDLPDLPLTPVEAVATRAHPDAAVYQVGMEVASHIVLIGADVPAVDLRINSNCRVAAPNSNTSLDAPDVTCNGRYSRLPTKAIRLHLGTFEWLQARKATSGLSWDQFVARAEHDVDNLVAACRAARDRLQATSYDGADITSDVIDLLTAAITVVTGEKSDK